jgi:hypothetical protein
MQELQEEEYQLQNQGPTAAAPSFGRHLIAATAAGFDRSSDAGPAAVAVNPGPEAELKVPGHQKVKPFSALDGLTDELTAAAVAVHGLGVSVARPIPAARPMSSPVYQRVRGAGYLAPDALTADAAAVPSPRTLDGLMDLIQSTPLPNPGVVQLLTAAWVARESAVHHHAVLYAEEQSADERTTGFIPVQNESKLLPSNQEGGSEVPHNYVLFTSVTNAPPPSSQLKIELPIVHTSPSPPIIHTSPTPPSGLQTCPAKAHLRFNASLLPAANTSHDNLTISSSLASTGRLSMHDDTVTSGSQVAAAVQPTNRQYGLQALKELLEEELHNSVNNEEVAACTLRTTETMNNRDYSHKGVDQACYSSTTVAAAAAVPVLPALAAQQEHSKPSMMDAFIMELMSFPAQSPSPIVKGPPNEET